MVASSTGTGAAQVLFDFTRNGAENFADNWTEISDTMRASGLSKAAFVVQKSKSLQRAVFFTLLNINKHGTGYAAVQCETNFDLTELNNICIKCRGQGVNINYKMILRHKGLGKDALIFGQVFTAPTNDFAIVKLPLVDFKPYFRGKELPMDSYQLDVTAVTTIALKVDKGPHLSDNQPGVAVLEIDWIKATK